MLILLDTSLLGYLTHPSRNPTYVDCRTWFTDGLKRGLRFWIPSVCDYELRRAILLRNAHSQLADLDLLCLRARVLPTTPGVLRRAAVLWADLRRQGLMTAPDRDVNFDVIIGAHAQLLSEEAGSAVVATENKRHLGRMADARNWREIA